MKKILIVLGPTAVGKTDLALSLAKKFNGELVACDSRQVYKKLDIGTGKLPGGKSQIEKGEGYWEINGIRVWMYDRADPRTQYSVKDYIDEARKIIADISKREKLSIVVGGTGLYLKGLTEGFDDMDKPIDQASREKLEKLGVGDLQEMLMGLSPTDLLALNESDRKNKRRLIRKIELFNMYPYTITNDKQSNSLYPLYSILKIGLSAPRLIINQNIDSRLNSRLNSGLVSEAKALRREGVSFERMRQLGLEYGVLADLLEGKFKDAQLLEKLQNVNHQYAKRQMTWFKKEKDVWWFDITQKDFLNQVEKKVRDWYNADV